MMCASPVDGTAFFPPPLSLLTIAHALRFDSSAARHAIHNSSNVIRFPNLLIGVHVSPRGIVSSHILIDDRRLMEPSLTRPCRKQQNSAELNS
jgi:hypothetical protein